MHLGRGAKILKRRLALVTVLDASARRRILRAGPFDGILCVEARQGMREKDGPAVRLIDFKDWPEGYPAHVRDVYERVERLAAVPDVRAAIAAGAGALGLSVAHVANAAKKGLALDMAADAKIALLARRLEPDASLCLFADHPDLADPVDLADDAIPARAPASLRLKLTALAAEISYHVLRPFSHRKEPGPCAVLFDLAYDFLSNPEFPAFYRYFKRRDDVVYTLPKSGGEIHRLLSADGKTAWTRDWGAPGVGAKARALGRLLRLARDPAVARAPRALRVWLFKFLREDLQYRFLLESARPRIFIRVRADYEPFHPIATAVCEQLGVVHAGYSCGSYPTFNFYVAWLDFHVYGPIGPEFVKIQGPAWKDAGRISVIGPFTGETDAPLRMRPSGQAPTLGVFSTTTSDSFYMQRAFYLEFIERACFVARRLGARVVFKEKGRELDNLSFIRRAAEGLDFEIVSHDDGGPRASEVLDNCDYVLVMSTSTTAYEALARGRKLAVYELPWYPNPLAAGSPNPVARTEQELAAVIDRIAGLSTDEYERSVAPLVERFGKRADGKLVEDFIKSIENAP